MNPFETGELVTRAGPHVDLISLTDELVDDFKAYSGTSPNDEKGSAISNPPCVEKIIRLLTIPGKGLLLVVFGEYADVS